jgi:hypothetical protein
LKRPLFVRRGGFKYIEETVLWATRKYLKKGKNVWSNVPITGTKQLDSQNDVGEYMISDGLVIIDEAGIEYNNRNFKKFTDAQNYFFKYHRHYKLDIVIFSQGYDEMDKKLRILAQRLYVVKKSLIPFLIVRKSIKKRVGIDEMSKQIIDEYFFVPLGFKYIFAPSLWKMFNTYSRKELPQKEWSVW